MTREAVVSEALLNSFNLDARLQKDTVWMGDFPLSRVLLMNEARYPWFILVPRVDSVSEIYQLSSSDQIQLLGESVSLLKWMSEAFIPDKMNVAAIGNIVRQLHLHHVARKVGDPAWPRPVWGMHEPIPYGESELLKITQSFDLAALPECDRSR